MLCSDLSFIPTIDPLVVRLRKAHIPRNWLLLRLFLFLNTEPKNLVIRASVFLVE